MKNIMYFIYITMILIHLTSCAKDSTTTKKNNMVREFKNAPEWVTKGCVGYLYTKTGAKQLCGVGSSDSSNPIDALTIAKTNAKADISKKINSRIMTSLKDYSAFFQENNKTSDEQHIKMATEEISSSMLQGIEMVDSWTSTNGNLYVLMVLYNEQFNEAVVKNGYLSEQEKNAIIGRADKAFDELERETGK